MPGRRGWAARKRHTWLPCPSLSFSASPPRPGRRPGQPLPLAPRPAAPTAKILVMEGGRLAALCTVSGLSLDSRLRSRSCGTGRCGAWQHREGRYGSYDTGSRRCAAGGCQAGPARRTTRKPGARASACCEPHGTSPRRRRLSAAGLRRAAGPLGAPASMPPQHRRLPEWSSTVRGLAAGWPPAASRLRAHRSTGVGRRVGACLGVGRARPALRSSRGSARSSLSGGRHKGLAHSAARSKPRRPLAARRTGRASMNRAAARGPGPRGRRRTRHRGAAKLDEQVGQAGQQRARGLHHILPPHRLGLAVPVAVLQAVGAARGAGSRG